MKRSPLPKENIAAVVVSVAVMPNKDTPHLLLGNNKKIIDDDHFIIIYSYFTTEKN